jgi:dihydrofolate reductase
MGGATTARQFIERGLLDELRIHIAPVLLGQGTRLFGTMSDISPSSGDACRIQPAGNPFAVQSAGLNATECQRITCRKSD